MGDVRIEVEVGHDVHPRGLCLVGRHRGVVGEGLHVAEDHQAVLPVPRLDLPDPVLGCCIGRFQGPCVAQRVYLRRFRLWVI